MKFYIGAKEWSGLSKLIEECGEVMQVAGKLIGTNGRRGHWDGSDLRERLEEEIADLLAAAHFVIGKNGLDWLRIGERREMKLKMFNEWHERESS